MSRKRYPARIPRFAAGIRAQESRTGGGRNWWSVRWRTILESMGLGARLGRGRNYAVSGQVTELVLRGPHIEAAVVGTRAEAYRVTIDFRLPAAESRERILNRLRAEPMLIARLLAGDLPFEVEAFFREEELDLFPGGRLGPGRYDMTTACTCPDYANPCKHVSAVLLLLGEEIARRPLTLLECRGILEEDLCDED